MKLPRLQFLHLAAAAAALPIVSCLAHAQTYPARPVRIIAGFPADLVHIPYRGQPAALTDLLGGQVQVSFAPTPSPTPDSGRLRRCERDRASRLASRFRQVHRRGNSEMGQGDQGSQYQGGVTTVPRQTAH